MVKRTAQDTEDQSLAKKPKMDSPMNVDTPQVNIDEDLHSRQLAVYGKASMAKMANASLLILGMKGLGVEIAKNVILAGVKAVALYDPSPVQVADLGAHFYLSPDDIGKPTAQACKDKLQELNTAVKVTVLESISDEIVQQFQVVVCTCLSLEDAKKYDALCRTHDPPIPFIFSQICGVFGQIFSDFGPNFVIYDTDGERPHTGIIAGIIPSDASPNVTIVNCVEEERLAFEEGDLVTFSEVGGMVGINSLPPCRVKSVRPYMLEIELDCRPLGVYTTGGLVAQHKAAVNSKHRSLVDCIDDPGAFLLCDFSKIDRPALLHVAFQVLEQFKAQKGRFPVPGNAADIKAFNDMFQQLNSSLDKPMQAEFDEKVLSRFASGSSAVVNPMATMFGGVVAQEAVKAVSGKFGPISQWFYFDSVESLPDELLSEEEYAPAGGRYDHQIAVLGRTVQQKLESLNTFLVGAGALGCEFLKNLALMGIATAAPASVTVTDDDVIEKSNLSRQFLFRDWDIGQFKASVASAAASTINPAVRMKPLQARVSADTEDVFNDEFWQGLDVVINALDNVNARLYVDSRCVYFQKPLLESGTLGTKCNTQMVLPNMTENYGATRDPPEKSHPMCTLHSFPHNIDHCLTWARSEFEGMMEGRPKEVNTYLDDPEKYISTAKSAADQASRANMEAIVACLTTHRCTTFDDCLKFARKNFQNLFHDKIAQLIYTFPEDAKTSSGASFWSPPKRFPTPITFDGSDPVHTSYVQSMAILLAEMYGLEKPAWAPDRAACANRAAQFEIVAFVPQDNIKIETDPNAPASAPKATADDEERIEQLSAELSEIKAALAGDFKLAPVVFEKDDDTNFHMDLITASANLRARNYGIPEVEKLQAKLIAGRIIPAIATATALATGLVCLDLYKLVQSKPIEAFRNTFVNLALPLFAASEPLPMKKETFGDLTWSLWDRWELHGDLTVQEVLDWFEKKGLDAYSISCGAALLYNNVFPKHKARLPQKVSELVQTVAKLEIPDWRRHIDVVIACEDDQENDIDVPLLSIVFR